jgi:hypothetical protein
VGAAGVVVDRLHLRARFRDDLPSVIVRPAVGTRAAHLPIIQLRWRLPSQDAAAGQQAAVDRHLVAGSVDVNNGLHYSTRRFLSLDGAGDGLMTNNDLTKYLTDMPWKAVGWLPVTFYPAVIGLSLPAPLDPALLVPGVLCLLKVLFITAALGLSQVERDQSKFVFPYANEQMFGGYLGIVFGPLLVGRRYFRNVWYKIRGLPAEVDDSREGMSYRFAAAGVVVGIGLLVAFSVHAGLPISLSTVFFVLYYLLALAVARVRAEFGSRHDFHHLPDNAITCVMGTENLTQPSSACSLRTVVQLRLPPSQLLAGL